MTVFVFFFIRETKGHTLEDMDLIFGAIDQQQRTNDIERVLERKHGNTEAKEEVELIEGRG